MAIMAIGNELLHDVFPNTCAWEPQEWNKTNKQKKNVRREAWVRKEEREATVHNDLFAYFKYRKMCNGIIFTFYKTVLLQDSLCTIGTVTSR